MKKVLFKIISLILIFAHLSAVCLRDVGFAEEVQHIPPVPEGVDFNQLGRVPDIIGHGQPAQWVENVPIAAGSFSTGATEEPTGASFQKDILTSGDKFNHILDSLSADSFTGKAQMTIPIFFPGTNREIKPSLNVVYNSVAGNGNVGVGWSLDLGAVSRSTKKGVPKYDSSDIFIAQGQELVGVGGYEYRSKIEGGFVKYIFNGSSWQAIDKSGTKYFFGSTDNSRIVTSKGIYSWALDKVLDSKGNYLTASYIKEENNLYPQYIAYTGNEISGFMSQYKISFNYENRPDVTLHYIIGEKMNLIKRLQFIDILFGNDLMRRYIFEYKQSSSTKKSLLTKVTEVGSDGNTTSPPVTFAYRTNTGGWSADQSKWHIPDGDFIKSGQDQGRRLHDLNGDGIADFVISSYNPNESSDRQWLRQTFLNSKDGFSTSPNWWSVPIGYFAYKSDSGSDDGRRLVDLTGDGIPELIAANLWDSNVGANGQYKDAYEFKCLDNQNSQWVQNLQWNLPDGFFVYGQNGGIRIAGGVIVKVKPGKVDGGRRFGDINGDGLNDLCVAEDNIPWYHYPPGSTPRSVNTYINTGSGWQQDTRWNSPDGYFVTSSGDAGRRLTDINGDGLADWLVACDGYKATYLNTGSGWIRNDVFNIPDGDFSSGGRDQGRMLVDINGDGLVDLVIARGGYHAVYLNTGSGWRKDDSYNIPDGDFVDSDGRDQGRYLADLDGDGVVDICIAKDDYKKAYLNLAGPADLLVKAANGLGGESIIEYAPSTRYYNYYPNKTGKLPFAVQTVSKITASDGMGNSYSTSYSYSDGYFDPAEREFRGFGYVKAIDIEGNYTESYFKQDNIYKGRLSRQQQKDASGNILSKVENTWKSAQLYPGVNFPYLAQADNFIYDPANANNFKQTQLKYEYDEYGNPLKVISYGDVNIAEDDKTQVTEYVYNTSEWILSSPKHTVLSDAQGKEVSEKWFYYDGADSYETILTKGLLTKEESWLFNSLTQKNDKVSTLYAYDQYGNLVSVTDALGRVATTIYDTKCHSYPIQRTNALGQVVKTVYYGINDLSTDVIRGSGLPGQVKYVQDINGQKNYNIYDALGQIYKVIGPNDNESNPGVIYEYDLGSRPARVIKRVKTDYASSPNYLSVYQFYDGLGRIVESKNPAQNSPQGEVRQVISGIVKFDQRGQVKEKYFPYFAPASENYLAPDYNTPHASFSYDALGRLIQVANPDETSSSVSYRLWQKTTTDENNHKKSEYVDACGRIVKVEEHSGTQIYTTTYEYDSSGNLAKATDNQKNITQIWYDSFGRKIQMDDPDMGVWAYEYDNAGNLIKQTDTKGQILTFTYDSLNRLVSKKGQASKTAVVVALATYSYDGATKSNCIGRLSKVVDQSGSTEFFYDNLGREVKSVKSVAGSGSYTVERTYDALNRFVTVKYPDNSIIKYEYNPQGISKVVDATDAQKTMSYIIGIDYSPTGQITKILYGNGTETNYTYDPKTLRLSNLATQSPSGKIQDLSYQFDKTGNVTQLRDYINTATQSFLYDDLNRLTQAQGAYGTFAYQYDSIGNMINKEGVNLTYGKSGKLPHAVTKYSSNVLIDYDANGNMVNKGDLQLSYDVENRLIKTEDKSATPIVQTVSIVFTLNPGWNFISLPVIPSDLKISSVLSSITGKYDQVSRYNPVAKKFEHYVDNPKYDQFSDFEYGRGYQIYISDSVPVSLTVAGTLPLNKSVSLSAGCNLIFNPKNTETAVENVLSPLKLGVNYSKVLYYNAAQGVFQEYSKAKKEFTVLKPGTACYFYCLKAAAWTITNSPVSASASFIYDGDGGRVQKTDSSGSTIYIGSFFEKGSDGTIRKNIFAGSNRIATNTLRASSAGSAVGREETAYYHSDHLGSSNVITDKDGNQIGLTEFSPYGSVSKQTGSYDPKYKFTGKELDNTGLYFYGARYYDPQLGRFITPDTIVQSPCDPQSFNRYSYCRNNPINYVDPSGHKWKDIWKTIVGVLATVVSIAIPVLAPVMWAVNFAISAYTAVQTGNILGLAGGIIGGAVFGALGKGLALGLAARMGDAAWSFGGGAIGGGIEFGLGGFGAGFGAALASGESFKDSLKAGGFGAAIGATTGAVIQGSYVAGWQDSLHGYTIGELGVAQAGFALQSRNLLALPKIDSALQRRTSGSEGLYLHGTDLKGAVGIAASGRLHDGSWVTLPEAIDSQTGRMAAFLNPGDYQRFTSINPPKGEYLALTVSPKSSVVDRGLAGGGAPQFQIYGKNKVTEVYANLNP